VDHAAGNKKDYHPECGKHLEKMSYWGGKGAQFLAAEPEGVL